jgi:hypothetical protein
MRNRPALYESRVRGAKQNNEVVRGPMRRLERLSAMDVNEENHFDDYVEKMKNENKSKPSQAHRHSESRNEFILYLMFDSG